MSKNATRKPSLPAARQPRREVERYSESEREESEYESDGEEGDRSPLNAREEELDNEDEYEEDADEEAAEANYASEEDEVKIICTCPI